MTDEVGELGGIVKKGGSGAKGPGIWEKVNESMSECSRDYPKFVTGAADGMVYRVGDVKFDGFKDGVLIEVKGKYTNFQLKQQESSNHGSLVKIL